jgi:hypothetical protein
MTDEASGDKIAVRVRASDGRTSDDGWIRTAHRPLLKRIGEGALIAGGGTAVGVMLLPVPLVHIFGVVFALSTWWFGLQRARTETVVTAVGGTCPHCQQAGTFFAGFGRKRFRLPISTSCPRCSHALMLEALPATATPRR